MADFEFDVEPLRSLERTGARAARGLPPDEVRKLGAWRRKRRLTVAASVALLGAVVLAGGAAAVVGYVGSSNLEPAGPGPEVTAVVTDPSLPTPEPDVPPDAALTDDDLPTDESLALPSVDLPGGVIPADFPIDVDLPDYGSDGLTEGPDLGYWFKQISPCAAKSFPEDVADALVDAMAVRLIAPEVEVFRGLWVFESVADAESVLRSYIEDIRACPSVVTDQTVVNFTVEHSNLGDEGFMTEQSYSMLDGGPLPGLTQSALIRMGPALLIVSDYGEGVPGSESEQFQRQSVLDIAETLTVATCELLDGAC